MITYDEKINLIVSLSNLPALLMIFSNIALSQKILITLMVICSCLMHISETKHELRGWYPFNKYSNLFLWLDRIMAVTLCLYILHIVINNYNETLNSIIILGLVGLLLNMISELCTHDFIAYFAITHCAWHWIAYYIYYVVCKI